MTSERFSRVWGTILLTTTIFSLSLPACAQYSGGMGEPNDPYQIATAEDLMLLGETPEDYDKHFILTADIDLDPNLPGGMVFDRAVIAPDTNDTEGLFQGTWFTGTFDGNGHTVSHLTITGGGYLGLFGRLASGAEVTSLGVIEVNIVGSDDYVGGLAGENYGNITTSYSTGTIKGRTGVGGLVGSNEGDVIRCYCSGAITGTGWWVGGLVGTNPGSIAMSYSTGRISATNSVGGLVGYNSGNIATSYSSSTVNGTSLGVGGLVGYNGGSTVIHSYSTGAVSGGQPGGLMGVNQGDVIACFWDTQTSGRTWSAAGTGKTIAQMKTASTFLEAGWDFVDETVNGTEDIWQIIEGQDYPHLWWELPRSKYSGGTGDPNDPYQIATMEDLIQLGNNPEDYDKHFILTADIDLNPNLPGRKVFDKAVIAPHAGPFGWPFSGPPFAGVFDGGDHTISNLTINGTRCAGLVGQLASGAEVKNVRLVGANVSGSDGYTGGLVGLVGSSGAAVTNCSCEGTVSGHSYIGGLVGYGGARITRCYSSGTVNGSKWSIGGLVGYSCGYIQQCYSTATVSGATWVGGLVGENANTVTECYSTGSVTGYSNVGGLVGYDYTYSQAVRCFWDTQTSSRAWSAGGTGKTTSQMKRTATFTDWDFENIWIIDEGLDYPKLRWAISHEQEKYGGGIGTSYDPYQIWTAEQMNDIGKNPLDWFKYFRLMADIDLGIYTGATFNIIGVHNSYGLPFSGVFDGNGKTISNFTLSGSNAPSQGLFGAVEGEFALIENLTLKGANINAGSKGIVGALVGYLHSGTISGCYIEGGSVSGDTSVGGLIGICNGTVINCSSSANVSVSDSIAGGLIGRAQIASIITACSSMAQVSAQSFAGGLVGENHGTIDNCYSTAQASANKGGAGGLTVFNFGTIRHCYSSGKVSAPSFVGGLVVAVQSGGSTDGSFWNTQTSSQATSAGGTGKTTAEMQMASTFLEAGWDFMDETANDTEDIWWIDEGQDYPRLWWELIPDEPLQNVLQ